MNAAPTGSSSVPCAGGVTILRYRQAYRGIPAFDNREWLRSTAAFRRLGEMQRTLRGR